MSVMSTLFWVDQIDLFRGQTVIPKKDKSMIVNNLSDNPMLLLILDNHLIIIPSFHFPS